MDINTIFDKVVGGIRRFFVGLPIWVAVVHWAKNHTMLGLKKVTVYEFLKFIFAELQRDTIVTRANSMAFSFFLAVFPGMIFSITLLPYLPYGDNFFTTLEESIKTIMPGSAGSLVFETVRDLLKNERLNLLSFGFILALWFSSNGMLSMMNGLRKEHSQLFRRRSMIEQRLVAIKLTFMLTFILFASVVFVILGNTLLNFMFQFIELGWFTQMVFFAFRWVAVLLLIYMGISIIYRYGSSARERVSMFNVVSIFATLASVVASWAFSFYIDNFNSFNTVYGSIGTIMAFMLWIQINCYIILVGFELIASIAVLNNQALELEAQQRLANAIQARERDAAGTSTNTSTG